MPKHPSTRSPAQTLLLGSLAVGGLLLAFALSFWLVSKGANAGWHNRAQSQIRSPAEEAQANQGWDPNRLLGGFSRQMPAPDSWANNFGKPLAYTKGIDADTYLYPEGTAPAPGSLILGEGDEAIESQDEAGSADASDAIDSSELSHPAPIAPAAPITRPAPRRDSGNGSPVGGLLNR